MSYNSFQHILTDDDVKSCLRCVEHHLTEGGLFLISMSIPKTSLLHRGKNKLFAATDIFEYQNYKCQFMEENNYDEKNRSIILNGISNEMIKLKELAIILILDFFSLIR